MTKETVQEQRSVTTEEALQLVETYLSNRPDKSWLSDSERAVLAARPALLRCLELEKKMRRLATLAHCTNDTCMCPSFRKEIL